MNLKPIFCTGAGTTPVDSGLPDVGRIFAVRPDGDLLWYQYLGNGVADRSGATGWEGHSGSAIGNGWGGFLALLGGGDGVVLAVQPDGALLWYQYTGDGKADRSGGTGWSPGSSNQIGRGWQGFRHLFVTPMEGHGNGITVFAVEPDGDLRWYRYNGDGRADPTGGTGWHPNSGNLVGNGWAGFQRIVGTGAGIFAVEPNGDLRWYRYDGSGQADVSGATGWHPNSGSVIGNGWAGFTDLTGCSTDRGGFAAMLFAVSENGDMRWYRYDGHGEPDRSGATGWHANSGNIIGNGW
jgi:hypothetical protein